MDHTSACLLGTLPNIIDNLTLLCPMFGLSTMSSEEYVGYPQSSPHWVVLRIPLKIVLLGVLRANVVPLIKFSSL